MIFMSYPTQYDIRMTFFGFIFPTTPYRVYYYYGEVTYRKGICTAQRPVLRLLGSGGPSSLIPPDNATKPAREPITFLSFLCGELDCNILVDGMTGSETLLHVSACDVHYMRPGVQAITLTDNNTPIP